MSISFRRQIASEIFSHPDDLEIVVSRPTETDKYSIGIYRGPEGKFTPLATSIPFSTEVEDAIQVVGEFLRFVVDASNQALKDKECVTTHLLNFSGNEIDRSLVLNPDRIELILAELRGHGIASTYKMLAPEG